MNTNANTTTNRLSRLAVAASGCIALACAALLSCAALAQSAGVAGISGSFGTGTKPVGSVEIAITFGCRFESGPAEPCTGAYVMSIREAHCTQRFQLSNAIAFAGLDLTRAGSIAGTSTLTNGAYQYSVAPDGSCSIVPGTFSTYSKPFTGTWNGSTGTIAYAPSVDARGNPFQLTGTFKVDTAAAPIFPMTVSGSITPAVSNIQATIRYRPQDVGTYGSVYVFALAPATIPKEADDGSPPFVVGRTIPSPDGKDIPVACVLAQLNSARQLQAVSVSGLQAYITGVLSAQGQAVTILDGVPTANIDGATFYVGYGPDAATMISNGINRSVVTVPGARECRPQPPQTGWWWNPQQGGRGFSIEAAGHNLFVAAYLYDVSGASTWHVTAGPTSFDGALYSGPLMSFANGVTLTGPWHANARVADAGLISLTFDDATHGTLVWPGGAVAIQRYAFGSQGTGTPALANQPENGWWWGGTNDDGRGFFIEWQGARAFLAGYMYDAQGRPTWYVADAPVTNAQVFQGTWLAFANGQTLTGPYRAPTLVNPGVAPVTITFQGAGNALITLPGGTLPITRFRF